MTSSEALFVPTIFAVAGALGILIIIIRAFSGKGLPGLRSLIGGLALGIPNYGSIVFLVFALDSGQFDASEFWPLNNMSVVALSALLAYIIFKERLTVINWIGIGVSIAAIGIISFYDRIL